MRVAATKLILVFCGLMMLLPALALLFAPRWFYDAIADFPPFNRHFAGDAGAFSLALGVGLMIAARKPIAHRNLIGVAALGNVIHVLNHLYDDLIVDGGNIEHILSNTLPLVLLLILLIFAWRSAANVDVKT
jgi:predicted anti-sigma-YlaC factor YlaD